MTSPRHTFRMSNETAEKFRKFAAALEIEAGVAGNRVTQSSAMDAMLAVAANHREEVLAELAKAPQTAE